MQMRGLLCLACIGLTAAKIGAVSGATESPKEKGATEKPEAKEKPEGKDKASAESSKGVDKAGYGDYQKYQKQYAGAYGKYMSQGNQGGTSGGVKSGNVPQYAGKFVKKYASGYEKYMDAHGGNSSAAGGSGYKKYYQKYTKEYSTGGSNAGSNSSDSGGYKKYEKEYAGKYMKQYAGKYMKKSGSPSGSGDAAEKSGKTPGISSLLAKEQRLSSTNINSLAAVAMASCSFAALSVTAVLFIRQRQHGETEDAPDAYFLLA